MCRVLAYVGQPVLLDDLLYKPDSSLVTQAYSPRMLQMLNLAGFGLMAWDKRSHEPQVPFTYRTTTPPMFDANLKGFAGKLKVEAALAHVRGVAYSPSVSIGDHNLHPFRYEGCRWALAHNGDLARFPELKYRLVEHVKPALAQKIRGTTDSEWMYALLLSQLERPDTATVDEVAKALVDMIKVLRACREDVGIDTSSPANLFLCDGESLVAARFTFDYGCYPTTNPAAVHELQLRYLSLWYTAGIDYGFTDGEWKMRGGFPNARSVMVASEPLTRDVTTWVEVPPYGLLVVDGRENRLRISSGEIDG